ncbi:MAG: hypothetical protein WC413_04630, partial [Candidatus Nanoarchaeia archaeon]
ISDYASADELKAELLALAAGDEELLALINSVTVTAGMTAEEFFNALVDMLGLTDAQEALLLVLFSIDAGSVDSAEELMLLLIKAESGDNAAVNALIGMLLTLDLSSFEDAEDLLNMLLLLIGGPALTELKDKLVALAATIDTYTTAVGLLNALTDTSTTLDGFKANIIDLINSGVLTDSDVLNALKKIANGEGAAALVDLILSNVPAGATRDALISVISGDNLDLFNLLSAIDMTGITTTEQFVDAIMSVDTDSDTYPDLIEILLGTDPTDPAIFPASLVYRYELKDGAKLKSQTFYVIDKKAGQIPQSIADYTLTYYQDGTTIRDTTMYYYENPDGLPGDVRAGYVSADPANSVRDSRKTRSFTYRGDSRSSVLDYDADGFGDLEEEAQGTDPYDATSYPAGTPSADTSDDNGLYTDGTAIPDDGSGNIAGDGIKDDAIKKSETVFAFRSEAGNYTNPGDEVADYTYTYTYDGQSRRETTIYFYENDLKRAQDSTVVSRKKVVVTYLDDAIDRNEYEAGFIKTGEDGIISGAQKKTETFYWFDALTVAGEEISDYTYNYLIGTPNIKETIVYKYQGDIRASQVQFDTECMERSITYIGEAVVDQTNDNIKSETFYYSKAGSIRGDEFANYTCSYNTLHHVVDTTYYKYGATYLAADDPNTKPDDAMTKSLTYGYNGALKTESFYIGYKGEEKVDYAYQYFHIETPAEDVKVQRLNYTYYDDDRIDKIYTYDIKNLPDPEHNNSLLISTTTYNYDAVYDYVIENTLTEGIQYLRQNPAIIIGRSTTVTNYNDYQIQTDSHTSGTSYQYYGLPAQIITGTYTTDSIYDEFGTTINVTTNGETRNAGGVSGVYTTTSDQTTESYNAGIKQIDEYGVIRESTTLGSNLNGEANVIGRYYSVSSFNEYGTMNGQESKGYSQNVIGSDWAVTSIWQQTEATFDVYGTLTGSVVESYSGKGHALIADVKTMGFAKTDFSAATGYSRTENGFDSYGVQIEGETRGESYGSDDVVVGKSYINNAYNDYGVVTGQLAQGFSQNFIGSDWAVTSVWSQTASTFDIYGTLTSSEVRSLSGKGHALVADAKVMTFDEADFATLTGRSVTANAYNDYGIQTKGETYGESLGEDKAVIGKSYTDNTYNKYGIVTGQIAQGFSQNFIGSDWAVTSVWSQTSSTFDIYGTLTSSEVRSLSGKGHALVADAKVMTFDEADFATLTGRSVTTNAYNDYGIQT